MYCSTIMIMAVARAEEYLWRGEEYSTITFGRALFRQNWGAPRIYMIKFDHNGNTDRIGARPVYMIKIDRNPSFIQILPFLYLDFVTIVLFLGVCACGRINKIWGGIKGCECIGRVLRIE